MNEHCAFCGGNDWTEIDSKKVHCLKCGANRFLSQALPKKPKKAKTEEKPTSAVSPSSGDEISEDEPTPHE
jgi:predicted  nucleic acid-binding Zn-ribbon protein